MYNFNEKNLWKPIQTGVILSTSSILKLQENLFKNNYLKFLFTSRFSQNALKNSLTNSLA